jgi:predicted secreted hydrolase
MRRSTPPTRVSRGSARPPGGALVLALIALGSLGAGAAPRFDAGGWQLATVARDWRFPRDHAAHPEFRTEWWYYTGHLEADGRRFGYELTFFRVGIDRARASSPSAWAPHTVLFAHAALTDEQGGRFAFAERIARPALGMAGADTAQYHVWVDEWSVRLGPDARTHALVADAGEFALALELVAEKPPALHGERGLSRKAAGEGRASHYASLTRLETRGTVTLSGRRFAVRGSSWMDHEFGSGALAEDQVGWDWVSLQLDDGRDLMLYRMRRRDGTADPASSGTLVERDGRTRHLPRDAFELRATGAWTSPHTGTAYPSGWTIRVPGEGLELEVEPTLRDQELRTEGTAGLAYWEGSVRARGRSGRGAVAGRGYVELTGYAGGRPGF